MKILVAGASGVIGRSLVPLLIQEGHDVIGLIRRPEQKAVLKEVGASAVQADVLDRTALFSALAEASPDVVIHQLTALQSMDGAANARLRTEGTRNLVDASLAVGVRRMIAQSITMNYAPGEGLASEDSPLDVEAPEPRLTSVRGVQALESTAAEMPESVILRYGVLYGAGTWYAQDGVFAEEARLGRLPATDGVTSFVHTEDAAAAAVLALNWTSGTYNIVDHDPAPGTAWVPVYADLLGAPAPKYVPGPTRGERGATNDKAVQSGWRPRFASWREGFAAVLR
ncbi:dTDP-glucose 4,6-dehydratase [Saccharibacillus sp. O16]|nr:dTDP-glucose 4,6-dehydratase [Saccharibacillus sp. O16]